MPRSVTNHHVNECNKAIEIMAGEPTSGGASVEYRIMGPDSKYATPGCRAPVIDIKLPFQNGPTADGINGITNEVLLAIVEDRLMGFQLGKFANQRNQDALHHIRNAQESLKTRTQERVERGVEGTHTV